MISEKRQLSGGLYLVPTPIGNARDITLRALDVLSSADLLAAEDTRTLRHLLEIHAIPLEGRRIHSWHDHSTPRERAALIEAIAAGKSLAYASDAGTPLISDPGYLLLRDCLERGLPVTSLPGPSAVLTALTLSGLPAETFQFLGFPPVKGGERRKLFQSLATSEMTTILFESARRSAGTIQELLLVLGEDRPFVLARELTKKFETLLRGTLGSVAADPALAQVKGEVVLLIGRAKPGVGADDASVIQALKAAMATDTLKNAVAEVADQLGRKRRDIYQIALGLRSTADGDG